MKILTPEWIELSASTNETIVQFEINNVYNIRGITNFNSLSYDFKNDENSENIVYSSYKLNFIKKEKLKNQNADILLIENFKYWAKHDLNNLCKDGVKKLKDIQNDDSLQQKNKRIESGLASDNSISRFNDDLLSIGSRIKEKKFSKNKRFNNYSYINKNKESHFLKCFKQQQKNKISDKVRQFCIYTESNHFLY